MVEYITKEEKSAKIKFPYIKLYTAATSNGFKLTILLELLKLDYYVCVVDYSHGECKQNWYLKFNPNGRIPTLEYADTNGDITYVNESAAILLFLADKFDKNFKYSFPHGSKEYYEMLEWIFFQMSGLGPMKGQYHWFSVFAAQKDEFAINRYYDETLRLFGVLEERLKKNNTGFLVSDHLTLADIVAYPWVVARQMAELKNYPKLSDWIDVIANIPEVKKAFQVPPSGSQK